MLSSVDSANVPPLEAVAPDVVPDTTEHEPRVVFGEAVPQQIHNPRTWRQRCLDCCCLRSSAVLNDDNIALDFEQCVNQAFDPEDSSPVIFSGSSSKIPQSPAPISSILKRQSPTSNQQTLAQQNDGNIAKKVSFNPQVCCSDTLSKKLKPEALEAKRLERSIYPYCYLRARVFRFFKHGLNKYYRVLHATELTVEIKHWFIGEYNEDGTYLRSSLLGITL